MFLRRRPLPIAFSENTGGGEALFPESAPLVHYHSTDVLESQAIDPFAHGQLCAYQWKERDINWSSWPEYASSNCSLSGMLVAVARG